MQCTLHGACFYPHEVCTFDILLLKVSSRSFAVPNTSTSKLATLNFTEIHLSSSYIVKVFWRKGVLQLILNW